LKKEVLKEIEAHDLKAVRFSFADQHGVLRGKTLAAGEARAVLDRGVTLTSTLLLKDTSHRTVFPAFTPGGGVGMPEMQGRHPDRSGSLDLPHPAVGAGHGLVPLRRALPGRTAGALLHSQPSEESPAGAEGP
jgi:hypothetical protein